MINNDLDNYMKAIKSKNAGVKNIELISSKRKQAWENQGGKCAKCKKNLKSYFCKYIEDPKTKTFSIICSDCAIEIPKRKC